METIRETGLQKDQKEMRMAFLGGFAGQVVSGTIWLIASAISTFYKPGLGMLILFFGCMGIFPLTQLALKIMGRPAKVQASNGLWHLGAQVAFTVPINFLLVWLIIQYNQKFFFPAAMIIVGAHYLPFITLYGMKLYAGLAGVLIFLGTGLMFIDFGMFSLGGWISGLLMIGFAFAAKDLVRKEELNGKTQISI